MLLLLTSCSSLREPQPIEGVKLKPQLYKVSAVAPVDVKLHVINKDGEVYFGFRENDYITFSQWLNDILENTKKKSAIIKSYEAIYEGSQ